MTWRRSPDAVVSLLDEITPDDARLVRRKMFGYASVFVGGRLCFGLHEHRLVLRLPPERRSALIEAGTAAVFAPAGRQMANFAAIEDPLAHGRDALRLLVDEAIAHVAALPPKPRTRKGIRKTGRGKG